MIRLACVGLLGVTVLGCGGEVEVAAPPPSRLVPVNAPLALADSLPRNPATLPADDPLAEQVRYGLRLMNDTPALAPDYVGNALSCTNCHLNAGQREKALPLVGIAGLFPLYRARDGRLVSLEDRIRGCFLRSMNGTAPPYDSSELLALSAYITWLSEDQPVGQAPDFRGLNRIPEEARLPLADLDVDQGEALFAQYCVVCHGADGQGMDLGVAHPGPLWGPQSWNDGAGAARIYTLAGFIRHAMPLTVPGMLTDEQAQHLSAYINSHERPVYPNKEVDYPGVEIPLDAVYDPRRFERNPLFGGE
ncbi:MAG: c-type cytochrome [Rhodothermaceae bacterium]|nr:c-type cytochrome [Rhodothermaceae bacterium]